MLYRLLWRPRLISVKLSKRLTSSTALQLQSQIQHHDLVQLPRVWEAALQQSRQTALSVRNEFYRRVREAGFPANSDWSLAILSTIPRKNIRYADYHYAAEVLLQFRRWADLHIYLTELAAQQPVMWQTLFLWLLKHSDSSLPPRFALETLAVSCINMGLKLENLASDADQPIFDMLKLMETRFRPEVIVDVINNLSQGNMVIAAPLATSLLSTKCDIQMRSSKRQPAPLEHVEEPLKNDLAQLLWLWKSQWSVATSTDLHLYMLYLVYQRRPREALKVYDTSAQLHDPMQSDAVLLAAAVDSDYIRLQQTFDDVESDPTILKKMGSRRYSTVLRALGYIGDANVLDGIYEKLEATDPALLTRGVYHALIQSHGLRGDLTRARAYYDEMMKREIEPTSSTFKLVLRAYKDAQDLRGALEFVGDELIARHQFRLGNAELSLLLSLCAMRHDVKSAEYIWKWGTTQCEPDELSWQTLIHCYAQANDFDKAWSAFDELAKTHKPSIDTLTALLQAAARFKTSDYATKALSIKEELQLRGDDAWYVAVLQYFRGLGDLESFESTLSEMRTQGLRLNASHYALYTEMLAQVKDFERAKLLPAQMARNRVPITHAFIGKHLRMLTAKGTSVESAISAEKTALQHIHEGYFDPHAAMVPRGVVPVGNIKPIVRRFIKRGFLGPAKKLLDSLRVARGSEKPLDTYQLWALYIELAHAAQKYDVVNKLWDQFIKDLSSVYVLVRGAVNPAKSPPVYKLARRHRHTFWQAINAKLDSMVQENEKDEFLAFPEYLEAKGIEMNQSNWNVFIQGLLQFGEPERAFESARKITFRRFAVSRLTYDKLRSFANDVDAAKYGVVGAKARRLAERHGTEKR